jgi:hypothetical protein
MVGVSMLHVRSLYSCMLRLPFDLDAMLPVRDSPSESLLVARQIVRMELLEAALHIVGVMIVVV